MCVFAWCLYKYFIYVIYYNYFVVKTSLQLIIIEMRKIVKVFYVSLGCDKNLVDSEKMLGMLHEAHYELTDNEYEADIIIVNTCAFIGDAKEESINNIIEMGKLKETGKCRKLIVTGCLAQRYKEEIKKELPEVDMVFGMSDYKPDIIKAKRIVTTGGHYAHLKIAEGCDKYCTYCIIPMLRGHYRSYPMEDLVKEAETLVEGGVKELVLVAQETTLYGVDLYGKKMLHELLRKLCRINGLRWIRIMYCYPEEIYDELIQVMKEEPKICHYLDIPIQHASDSILKRMNRKTNRAELTERIAKLREEIPDIALRTSLIAGFPGETEEDHEELMEFIDEIEFTRLGVFTYSAEEGTKAAEMDGQVQEEVKEERRDRLMELQQEISSDLSQSQIGKVTTVMIEGKVADENAYVGRTYMDAPNVDGYIFVNTDEELMSGDFCKVKVTGALEYDLIGELVQ